MGGKKVPPGNPRQVRTNYRCSDQGLAGFACRTSTAPDSGGSQTQPDGFRNAYFRASIGAGEVVRSDAKDMT